MASELSKFKLGYEYDVTYKELHTIIKEMAKIKYHDKRRMRKLRKEGFTNIELAQMYNISVQRAAAITRKLK